MKFLEKDLETIIYEAPQDKLRARGLGIYYDRIYRQVNLGAYGIADIITVSFSKRQKGYYRYVDVTVYELKQSVLNVGTLLQSAKYVTAIQEAIKGKFNLRNTVINYEIVLIGSKLDLSGGFCYLPRMFKNLHLITYDYDFDGIRFKYEEKYSLKQSQFPSNLGGSIRTECIEIIRGECLTVETADNLPF